MLFFIISACYRLQLIIKLSVFYFRYKVSFSQLFYKIFGLSTAVLSTSNSALLLTVHIRRYSQVSWRIPVGPKEVCALACVLDQGKGKTLWNRFSLDPPDALIYSLFAWDQRSRLDDLFSLFHYIVPRKQNSFFHSYKFILVRMICKKVSVLLIISVSSS